MYFCIGSSQSSPKQSKKNVRKGPHWVIKKDSPPKIQKVTKRSKKWRNGAKSNKTETKSSETETKRDETEQKVAKQTLLYGNMSKK